MQQHERLTPKSIFDWIRLHSLGPLEAQWTPAALDTAVQRCRDLHFERLALDIIPPDPELEQLREARLRIGAQRYSELGWITYETARSVWIRLGSYQQTGNSEHLVDALNLIVIEWLRPSIEGTAWDYDEKMFARAAGGLFFNHSYVARAQQAMQHYLEDGRRNWLAYAARNIHLEWRLPLHHNAHFAPLDDDPNTHHTEIAR